MALKELAKAHEDPQRCYYCKTLARKAETRPPQRDAAKKTILLAAATLCGPRPHLGARRRYWFVLTLPPAFRKELAAPHRDEEKAVGEAVLARLLTRPGYKSFPLVRCRSWFDLGQGRFSVRQLRSMSHPYPSAFYLRRRRE